MESLSCFTLITMKGISYEVSSSNCLQFKLGKLVYMGYFLYFVGTHLTSTLILVLSNELIKVELPP